jgi:hypothetical protein
MNDLSEEILTDDLQRKGSFYVFAEFENFKRRTKERLIYSKQQVKVF